MSWRACIYFNLPVILQLRSRKSTSMSLCVFFLQWLLLEWTQPERHNFWIPEKLMQTHSSSVLVHSLTHPWNNYTWQTKFVFLFSLCSAGGQEAENLYPESSREEHWSHSGTQWVPRTVSNSNQILQLIKSRTNKYALDFENTNTKSTIFSVIFPFVFLLFVNVYVPS